MVVDKEQKTVWDRCGNPSKHQHQKPGEVPGTEGTTGAEVEGNRIVRTCNPKTGRMAPADFRHNGLVAIVDAGVGGVMVWGILLACFGHLWVSFIHYNLSEDCPSPCLYDKRRCPVHCWIYATKKFWEKVLKAKRVQLSTCTVYLLKCSMNTYCSTIHIKHSQNFKSWD